MFSSSRAPHSGNGSHGSAGIATGDFAEEARQRLDEVSEEVKKRVGDVEELVKMWVKTRPGLTLGAALAAGVVIGWLIKRR
jgi:ElaB/YqjD/DUF883 family membrane-anchored ribosome-binding protein